MYEAYEAWPGRGVRLVERYCSMCSKCRSRFGIRITSGVPLVRLRFSNPGIVSAALTPL